MGATGTIVVPAWSVTVLLFTATIGAGVIGYLLKRFADEVSATRERLETLVLYVERSFATKAEKAVILDKHEELEKRVRTVEVQCAARHGNGSPGGRGF